MKKFIKLFEADVSAAKGDSAALIATAIPRFLLRALHWGTLAMDFTDEEFATVWDLYYGSPELGSPGETVFSLFINS